MEVQKFSLLTALLLTLKCSTLHGQCVGPLLPGPQNVLQPPCVPCLPNVCGCQTLPQPICGCSGLSQPICGCAGLTQPFCGLPSTIYEDDDDDDLWHQLVYLLLLALNKRRGNCGSNNNPFNGLPNLAGCGFDDFNSNCGPNLSPFGNGGCDYGPGCSGSPNFCPIPVPYMIPVPCVPSFSGTGRFPKGFGSFGTFDDDSSGTTSSSDSNSNNEVCLIIKTDNSRSSGE